MKYCPNCDSETKFFKQNQKHYCYTCKKYVEPVEKEEKEVVSKTPYQLFFVGLCIILVGFLIPLLNYIPYYIYDPEWGWEPIFMDTLTIIGIIFIMMGLYPKMS